MTATYGAHVRNDRTGKVTTVRKNTAEEAVQQLSNILRINGWAGNPSAIRPGVEVAHRGFTYWVDSAEG